MSCKRGSEICWTCRTIGKADERFGYKDFLFLEFSPLAPNEQKWELSMWYIYPLHTNGIKTEGFNFFYLWIALLNHPKKLCVEPMVYPDLQFHSKIGDVNFCNGLFTLITLYTFNFVEFVVLNCFFPLIQI